MLLAWPMAKACEQHWERTQDAAHQHSPDSPLSTQPGLPARVLSSLSSLPWFIKNKIPLREEGKERREGKRRDEVGREGKREEWNRKGKRRSISISQSLTWLEEALSLRTKGKGLL